MLLQGQCQHCAGLYEYEAGNKSELCPHCGKETLCIPLRQQRAAATPGKLTPCLDCGAQMSRRALLCPACGSIPFWSIFRLVCFVVLAAAIFDLIRLLIDEIFKAISS